MIQFPKNFYWGAATSSYQVEGNNMNADWWPWEIRAGKERSGAACRHYELYEQDFDLAKSLNHNAHRLSVEWSRIEPMEGQFSQAEIEHYIKVILALRRRGIEPMVTLHHFTNPIWFSAAGGWTRRDNVRYFLRYCDVVTKALMPHVRYWFTINEPTVYFSHAFLWGMWPPQEKSILKAKAVHDHMIEAHIKAYPVIKANYTKANLAQPLVSIAHHMQAIVGCDQSIRTRWAVSLRKYWYNWEVLDRLARLQTLDFIGLNYYSRNLAHPTSWWIGNLLMETCSKGHDPRPKNSLGWDIYPEGIAAVLLDLKKYNLPVIISENGICTSEDNQRWEYIQSHLKNVRFAMDQGVDVIGYLYWSLMDNFEWAHGYTPRFGLIEVDYKTCQRTLRESAKKYAQVCQTGIIPT